MCCRNCTRLHDPVCRARAPRLGRLWGTWSLPRLEEPKKGSQSVLLFSPPVLSLRDPICLSSRRRGAAFPHLLVPPPTGNTSDFICSQNLGIIPFFNPMLLGAPATAPGFCPGLGVFSPLKGTIQRFFLCYCWSLLTKFFKDREHFSSYQASVD